MEALEDSSCPSLSDSFSLYERYVRSFNVVDNLREKSLQGITDDVSNRASQNAGNILLNIRNDDEVITNVDFDKHLFSSIDCQRAINANFCKPSSPFNLIDTSLQSSTTADSIQTEKSDPIEVPLTSEDSKSEHSRCPKPVIITSSAIMENSNNAVDSGPLFCSKSPESVFKLPINELTFNGSLKHVKTLKPIVHPAATLNSAVHIDETYKEYSNAKMTEEAQQNNEISTQDVQSTTNSSSSGNKTVNSAQSIDMANNSTGDSLYQDFYSHKHLQHYSNQEKILETSYSSLEGSFDSGVRSPDMFSDDDENPIEHKNFWDFLNEYEANDKMKIKKLEHILQGVLPPPSVTNLRTNVTEMLKKYYCFLPAFSEDANIVAPSVNSVTPTKRTSFIKIPVNTQLPEILQEFTETKNTDPPIDLQNDNSKSQETETKCNTIDNIASNAIENVLLSNSDKTCNSINEINDITDKLNDIINDNNDVINKPDPLHNVTNNLDLSNNFNLDMCNLNDCSIKVAKLNDIPNAANNSNLIPKTNPNDNMSTKMAAQNTPWPDILKCRYNDVYYNITKYSERMELLALRCGERFIGTETNSSVTVYSGDMQSPSSACKRKALRLKMAQAKSPGRRLSHLARRRQAFCSAATFGERPHASTAKMVLIDKNFFPHRKLINTGKSPRLRRTPGKRTPGRKTPAKKTPAKTPKTRSGGGSRKKVVRRLITDNGTRTLPTRETSKRALFISPENRKSIPQVASTSVPVHAMKSKRALFPSPDRLAETKSSDGSLSDQFMKRKREFDRDDVESKSKIAKSLSFGGDSISNGHSSHMFSRRASEMFSSKNSMANLDENQRKKLLWAVSEALRIHGWRMQSPGFREKAGSLARLIRRLLTLPYHNARMNAPKLSTSETFLKIARQYVFAIIKGKSIEDCFIEEQERLANETTHKVTGYISASTYQQIKVRQTNSLVSSRIKENSCDGVKPELQRSGSKNVLQDKLLNVDNNSNSSLGVSSLDKTGIYKSNSMPSFEEAAKMRARRQISFDNIDFPKR